MQSYNIVHAHAYYVVWDALRWQKGCDSLIWLPQIIGLSLGWDFKQPISESEGYLLEASRSILIVREMPDLLVPVSRLICSFPISYYLPATRVSFGFVRIK